MLTKHARYESSLALTTQSQSIVQDVGHTWDYRIMKYSELRTSMRQRFQQSNGSYKARLANLNSTLTRFQLFIGASDTTVVSQELGYRFMTELQKFSAALTLDGVKKTTIRDLRSNLRRWHELYLEERESNNSDDGISEFHATLIKAFNAQQESDYKVAAAVGVPRSTLANWLNGVSPNRRSVGTVRRLERHLCMELNTLVSVLHSATAVPSLGSAHKHNGAPSSIAFRLRHSANSKLQYLLRDDETPDSLLAEWQAYLQHKTGLGTLKLHPRGLWRLRPLSQVSSTYHGLEARARPNKVAPTGARAWSQLRSYLGFVRLAVKDGGLGVTGPETTTLAAFARPDWFRAYVGP